MRPCLDHFSPEENREAETSAKVLSVALFHFALKQIRAALLVSWLASVKQRGEEHFYGQ